MDQLILVTWKAFLIFFMLVVLSRSIGRKLLAQMSYFDFTVAITIGSLSGAYVVQMVEGMWVLIAPVILAVIAIAFDFFSLLNLRLRKLLEGEPVIVIHNGQILEKGMRKLRYHMDHLESHCVIKESEHLPLTPQDMNIPTKYKGIATEIIKDGKILEQNLAQRNLTKEWLDQELRNRNITDVSDIIYAALNTSGVLYVSLKQSNLNNIQKVED